MTTKERRKFMRIDTQLQTDYRAMTGDMDTGRAQVLNFSREGLRVLFPKRVALGEKVDLTLEVPGDNIPVFATAEVAWAESSVGANGSGAGLRFLSIKPLDLARLLDFVYSRWLGSVKEKVS